MDTVAYKWGGGIVREESKEEAPCLHFNITTEITLGVERIAVNGHRQRCLALEAAWEERFNTENWLAPIQVVDLSGETIEVNGFAVEITDVAESAVTNPNWVDVVINYQIGAEGKGYEYDSLYPAAKVLLGKEYFFTDDDDLYSTKKEQILIIPNGNKELFLAKLDLQELVRNASCKIVIADGITKSELILLIKESKLVITTPSVTAMECLHYGTPALWIKTNPDQVGEFSETNLAHEYSIELFNFLWSNERALENQGCAGEREIKNNIDKVVDIIYTEWRNRQ